MGLKLTAFITFFILALILVTGCQDSTPARQHPEPTEADRADEELASEPSPLQNTEIPAPTCAGNSLKPGRFTLTYADPCAGTIENHLLYIFWSRAMYVCEKGVTTWANYVVGGKGGFGKQRQGDKKVPNGIYQLGAPYVSNNFGLFIPINYPNAADRAAGRTGGSVGIHGPLRAFACKTSDNLFTQWTDGCIAYPADAQVAELARWLKKNPKAYIELRAH